MKKHPKNLFSHLVIILSMLVIIICFLSSMFVIREYAQEDCFDHVEETTVQISNMFMHTLEQSETQLMLFADILAANSSNPDELLQAYMENFCSTQNFAAVCIHRANGTTASYGYHPHELVNISSFEEEVARLPYTSDVFAQGETRKEQYVYQAVPIERDGKAIAVLYGYISLDTFPMFFSSTAYGGECQFYIVDGSSGQLLLDEYRRYGQNGEEVPLGNMADGSMDEYQARAGYRLEKMRDDVRAGNSGYFVFKSHHTGQWYYTYYMPMGINRWSMQMTVAESIAFATYENVSDTMRILMVLIVVFMFMLSVVLMRQNAKVRKKDNENLHKADYLNAVQSALITAHNNPDFVDQALKIMAKEIRAETILLLTFSDKVISQAYYWPSADKTQAMALLGMNIRDLFPSFFDRLSSRESVWYNGLQEENGLSEKAIEIFESFNVSNILLVPIMDNMGTLKGAIAAINGADEDAKVHMLECVSRDFFMAISNLESHNIIKSMGAMDYLTGLKNRNCFETETAGYETMEADSLWCMYVDANGLHELNNQHGHKAGDLMLCAIANAIKKIFGAQNSYRLGGDEFVAYKVNGSHEEMMSLKYRLLEELARKGYSVSVGFEGMGKNRNGVFDVEQLLTEAETLMYRDKRKYYLKNQISPEREHELLDVRSIE